MPSMHCYCTESEVLQWCFEKHNMICLSHIPPEKACADTSKITQAGKGTSQHTCTLRQFTR